MRGSEFAELMAFLAVAEERSFRRAAQRLGISPSALSHSMRALEERLGARLLHRTTRSVAPTEAGQDLLHRLRPAIAEVDEAVRDVTAFQQRPRGRVRINLPRAAAELVIMPKLKAFRDAYPDVRVDLAIDDAITDVVARGFDAGIRSGGIVERDMISVPLTSDLRMAVVGSPALLGGLPKIGDPADLKGVPCVTYRWLQSDVLHPWRFDGPDGPIEIIVDSVLTTNATDMLLGSAIAGVGLAYLVESLVAPPVFAGSLVRVLEDWCRPFPGFYLYFSSRRQMPSALRVFVDFMKMANPYSYPQHVENS
ncbi:LysR family transcriptional regulator [Sphingomonas paucimobilis]|jgi:DNA-binding transcriptional LysR family regulator|uniref:LysR family transcriptional regulator n=2 Tax=Sphingomonas TaxID=13687 RepID=A0A7T3E706_SPHPI|nr:LysR family transcriptional regulator [Sphingomonas paucimobilis]QPT11217.1 LysR family transcriptional regulator [Sphingomonas paucimobilis]